MTEDLREAARKRIKGRRDFWTMVLIFVAVTILLNIIWLTSPGPDHYYWPMWPMIGFVIAIIFTAIATFGPGSKPITEARIDEEIRRMGGSPN